MKTLLILVILMITAHATTLQTYFTKKLDTTYIKTSSLKKGAFNNTIKQQGITPSYQQHYYIIEDSLSFIEYTELRFSLQKTISNHTNIDNITTITGYYRYNNNLYLVRISTSRPIDIMYNYRNYWKNVNTKIIMLKVKQTGLINTISERIALDTDLYNKRYTKQDMYPLWIVE